ncbi:hypothetical protein N7471_001232 [Penicillium samsonianum]|uniref:uncharacterized protein n=1 Tax=Penicillium samsonianum TaxID=1882272 RepID=UPI0025490E61|nr:uncharacterized protein N7471_001232 [Penicillium samsonianum]KAJ6150033.1 hypothetical protein N7471_001232 [Penicillium samsonianum]
MPPSKTSTVLVSPPRPPPTKSPTESRTELPAHSASLPLFTVPVGWTTNPPSPAYKGEWEGPESEGQMMARYFGLGRGRPSMENTVIARHDIFRSLDCAQGSQ